MALGAWSWGYSIRSIYSVSELLHHLPNYIFYTILQIIAAVLTIRIISLRKLFYLSCIFSIIGALLTGFNHQMMKVLGCLSFPLFFIGHLLPYVAPVLILALINRKKTASEPAPYVEKEKISTSTESELTVVNKAKVKIKTLYERYWYIFDILLIILVILYGTLNDPFALISYVCGLYNKMIIMAFMVFVWVFLLVPAALCLVVLLLRMIISWPKYIKKKSRLLILRLFTIVGLSGYLIIPFTPIRPHGFNIYIKGFSEYVKANADIEAIRGWLGTLSPEDCVEYDIIISGSDRSTQKSPRPKSVTNESWPKEIIDLDPRFVELSLDDEHHPKVRLNWGSGFLGTWGLVVGNESMPTPTSDLSPYGEYRKEIRKGVYVWYEIQ